MIKYIKTKDNKIVKIDLENNKIFTSKYEVVGFPEDDIEELIDCLVFTERSVYNGQEHKYIMYKPFIIEEDNIYNTTVDIKGANWTDKGLIYVTKMKGILPNGKIDWELL